MVVREGARARSVMLAVLVLFNMLLYTEDLFLHFIENYGDPEGTRLCTVTIFFNVFLKLKKKFSVPTISIVFVSFLSKKLKLSNIYFPSLHTLAFAKVMVLYQPWQCHF